MPYETDLIESFEKLQNRAIRWMFGFLKSTKQETMLAATGIPSMKSRYLSLKLTFANKIFSMPKSHYVRHILTSNWNQTDGFGADIKAVFADWKSSPEFVDLCSHLLNQKNHPSGHAYFHDSLKTLSEELDLGKCKESMQVSVDHGTGQPGNVLKCLSDTAVHCLLPQLRVEIPRHHMVQFMKTLSGCDMLTPFNFSKKPKCKFCACSCCDWVHLFFKCKNHRDVLPSIVDSLEKHINPDISDPVNNRIHKCISVIHELEQSNHFQELFSFLMGCTLPKYNLYYQPILNILIKLTSKKLYEIFTYWEST